MKNESTTLNPIEVETIKTFGQLEKTKKLYQFNKNKSFLHAGFTALSLGVGASFAGIALFTNIGDPLFVSMAAIGGVVASFGLGDVGLEAAKEAKIHEAEAITLTEKISILRDKLKNNTNQITTPNLNK